MSELITTIAKQLTWDDRVRAVIGSTQDHAWPYGANSETMHATRMRLLEWAERNEVRYSPNGECLHWLTRGRSSVAICRVGRAGRPHWMDHVTGWTRQGKPVMLIAQPYHIGVEDLHSIAEIAKHWNVAVDINGMGWYGHGTVQVVMMNRANSSDRMYEQPWSKSCENRQR